MKKSIFGLTLVLALVLAASCNRGTPTATTTGAQTYRDVLRIGLDVDAGTIDPRVSRATTTVRVIEQVYDSLIDLDDNLQPQPCLAESWENPDPLTWIFHLRRGVKFHNGADFTSLDVKKTYEDIINPEIASTARATFSVIQNINADDPYTVIFNLREPYAPLLPQLNIGIVPKDAGHPDTFGLNPIDTGPYIFKEWLRNSRIVVEANPNHFNGPPKTRTIEFYVIPDNSTRVAALEAGDVDIIHSPLSPSDVNRMKANSAFTVFETPGLGVTFLNFNWGSTFLGDQKVRQAISHLLDKTVISRDIYMNMDVPGVSTLLPSSWAYTDSTPNYAYDPARAAAVFAEAGWTRGSDGYYTKGGRRLQITLSTHTEDPNRIQVVEYLQNVHMQNGIYTDVSTVEWPTFDANVVAGRFDICLIGLVGITDPDRYLYTRFHTRGSANYSQHGTPRLDTLLVEARQVGVISERARLYREAAAIINEEVMHNILLYQKYIAIYNNNVEGFQPMAAGYFRCLPNVTVR